MLCANQSNINKKQTAFPLYIDIQITSSYVPGTGASTQSDLDLGRDWQTQQILYEGTSKVQNNVAHLSLKTPGPDHITHHLCTLLDDARIKFRISSQCFSAITSTGLVYISDLHKIYMPPGQLWSSTDSHTLCVSSFNTKSYGERLTLKHTSKKHQIFSISFFLLISTQNENSPADLYLHKTLLIIIIYIIYTCVYIDLFIVALCPLRQ